MTSLEDSKFSIGIMGPGVVEFSEVVLTLLSFGYFYVR